MALLADVTAFVAIWIRPMAHGPWRVTAAWDWHTTGWLIFTGLLTAALGLIHSKDLS